MAPVASVLASADLRVRVERDTARGVFNLTGDVLRAGVSRVSLMSGATLIEASAAGRPVPLVAEGQAHTALLPGPGPFSLSLEWGAPLKFAPGRASFVLPVPPVRDRAGDDRSAGRSGRRPSLRRPGHAPLDQRGPDDRGGHAGSGLVNRGLVVDARQRAGSRGARSAHAGRRDDAPDAWRLRRSNGGADRSDRGAGRAADLRGSAAIGIRADGHFGKLARIERANATAASC